MPLFNWSVVILGQTDAVDQEKLELTLKNQTSISCNVAGSIKKIVVSSEPDSGLIQAPPCVYFDDNGVKKLREH